MDANEWLKELGWNQKQIEDLRLCAYFYIKQGIYDFPLTILKAITILNPSSPYELQTMGAIYLQTGNHIKALETLNAALQLDPTHLPTRLNLAKTLLTLGYKKQGLAQANSIERESLDPNIKEQASALIFAYGNVL